MEFLKHFFTVLGVLVGFTAAFALLLILLGNMHWSVLVGVFVIGMCAFLAYLRMDADSWWDTQ